MNYKISDINNLYLQEVIAISATSTLEILQTVEFRSATWDIYVSGLAYGIFISICDEDSINLNEIDESINNRVITFLN